MKENKFERYINVADMESAKEYLQIFIDFYCKMVLAHHYDTVRTQREADAHIVFQMILSKAMNFKQLLDGVEYKGQHIKMKRIMDPTLLFTLVRNLYETLCAFELINIIPDSEEKKNFLFLIYQISALKYRQRFSSNITLPDNFHKQQIEAEEINDDIQKIYSSPVFQRLDQKYKDKLNSFISKKQYQLYFKNDTAIDKKDWKDIAVIFGMKKECVENLYTYFCLNAHPSYAAIMQFRDAFSKENPEFINLALFAAHTFLIFLSVFLVDYMRMCPTLIGDFKRLDEEKQALLTAFNDIYREDEYKFVL